MGPIPGGVRREAARKAIRRAKNGAGVVKDFALKGHAAVGQAENDVAESGSDSDQPAPVIEQPVRYPAQHESRQSDDNAGADAAGNHRIERRGRKWCRHGEQTERLEIANRGEREMALDELRPHEEIHAFIVVEHRVQQGRRS
jgi:hypothetical protein